MQSSLTLLPCRVFFRSIVISLLFTVVMIRSFSLIQNDFLRKPSGKSFPMWMKHFLCIHSPRALPRTLHMPYRQGRALFSSESQVVDNQLEAASMQLADSIVSKFLSDSSRHTMPTQLPAAPINTASSTLNDDVFLLERQLVLEEEMHDQAVKDYNSISSQLQSMERATGQIHVKSQMLQWYNPLCKVIVDEINKVFHDERGNLRSSYGPFLLMLPVEKLAVITLDTTINMLLSSGNCAVISELAGKIGRLVEFEVTVEKGKNDPAKWKRSIIQRSIKGAAHVGRPNKIIKRLIKLLGEEEWTVAAHVKVGSTLINFLINSAFINADSTRPALEHAYLDNKIKSIGILRMKEDLYKSLTSVDNEKLELLLPRYLPMIVPPRQWDNRSKKNTCYLRLRCKLIRTQSPLQQAAVTQAHMPKILESLNYMSNVPWKINLPMLDVVEKCWVDGIMVGEMVSRSDFPLPAREEAVRTPLKPYVPFVSSDANSTILSISKARSNIDAVAYWKQRRDKIMTEHPEEDPYWTTPQFDQRYYDELVKHIQKKNSELHSLRCDMELKLSIAKKFQNETFYFPFSLDFRGRAYPVPPNLNHLGSDLCRALLMFEKAQPLGERGLDWLKIHLANVCGNNKISQTNRIAWVDSIMDKVRASAENPLGEGENNRWWMTGEEPFQILAVCKEIINAINSGAPANYMCSLPIHQDGSCNGLQHYAALGRDAGGGAAVNLCPSSQPQDVYSKVLEIVNSKIAVDAQIPADADNANLRNKGIMARHLLGKIDRKIIKQSVMTSVYGVTRRGASLQVFARLQERFLVDADAVNLEKEKELIAWSIYVAGLVMDSLGDLFKSADTIMKWLGDCATIVASQGQSMSWITPLGLPVVQPYRKNNVNAVKTLLQTVILTIDDDHLPVSPRKQRSAFPPNFVHSLDATHMTMTSLKMKDLGLTFAAVHDSYWTHACHVDTLNKQLRDCFVDLYSQPILESLLESLERRFPNQEFPPVPKRGTLDLKSVLKSEYFFH